jgi:hypothetical protein
MIVLYHAIFAFYIIIFISESQYNSMINQVKKDLDSAL